MTLHSQGSVSELLSPNTAKSIQLAYLDA